MGFPLYQVIATVILSTVPIFPQTVHSTSSEVTEVANSTLTRTVIDPIDQEQLDSIAAEKERLRKEAEERRIKETASREKLHLPLPEGSYSYSSDFGPRCDAGIATGAHLGIDLAAASGTPMYSIASGEVIKVVDGSSSVGGTVLIRSTINGEAVDLFYHHMENSSDFVTEGDEVKAGQRISSVGSTGRSTGPHLHLEVWLGGAYQEGDSTAVDPEEYFKKIGLLITAKATSDTSHGNECPEDTPFNTSPQKADDEEEEDVTQKPHLR